MLRIIAWPWILTLLEASIMCSTIFHDKRISFGTKQYRLCFDLALLHRIENVDCLYTSVWFPKHKTKNQRGKRNLVPCPFNNVVGIWSSLIRNAATGIALCKSCLYRSPTSTVLCSVWTVKVRCFLCSDSKPTDVLCYLPFFLQLFQWLIILLCVWIYFCAWEIVKWIVFV